MYLMAESLNANAQAGRARRKASLSDMGVGVTPRDTRNGPQVTLII